MLSAITYMAYPAKAYATDWTYYPMLVTILLVSFPVIKYYLPFFRRLNVTSWPTRAAPARAKSGERLSVTQVSVMV